MKNLLKRLSTGALTAGLALSLAGCTTTRLDKNNTERKIQLHGVIPQNEKCHYVELTIQEKRSLFGTKFMLERIEELVGDYKPRVRESRDWEGDYHLFTVDDNNKVTGSYSLSSQLETLYDSSSGGGGSFSSKQATIFVTIPYSPDLREIIIDNKGSKTKIHLQKN